MIKGRKFFFVLVILLVIAAILIYSRFLNFKPESKGGRRLTIYSYSSFAQSWSAGPEIAKAFEKTCDCKVELLDVGESGIIIQRVKLSEAPVDVVIGLDQWALESARSQLEWKDISKRKVAWKKEISSTWLRNDFIPFDWSPLTFIYRPEKIEAPKSLDDLIGSDYRGTLTLQDPRTSQLGMQFYYWILSEKGQGVLQYISQLKKNVHMLAPSWSMSYGLFQKERAHMTFTYLTSLLYHWDHGEKKKYKVVSFPNGHPVQVEYAGIPKKCQSCDLAQDFLAFLLTPRAQRLLLDKNYMLPVIRGIGLKKISLLPRLKLIDHEKIPLFTRDREGLLLRWRETWFKAP